MNIISDKENIRIDKYLSELDSIDLTRAKIQKLIKTGNITVNGKEVKESYKINLDDNIEINVVKEETKLEGEDIKLDVVYEDDDILVINKPSGMVVHPAPGNKEHTLVNALINYSKLSKRNGEFRPGIVHRIDKDTSGLLIVAKNDKAHLFLENELKEHNIVRTYIALVNGVINHDTGKIDAPIGRSTSDRKKMEVTSKNSKEAVTNFKVLERFKNVTLLELKLETGRTHQIRVHLKYIGHPVCNDPVYSNNKNIDNYGQLLHAREITFIHPTTKEKMTFTSEPDNKFNEIMKIYEEK
jgi:23S rRNA pseudouridine1911/1915/1917 synthase